MDYKKNDKMNQMFGINKMNIKTSTTTTITTLTQPCNMNRNDVSSLASGTLNVNNIVNANYSSNVDYATSVATVITGVSSIAPSISIVDALIVIIGISEYADGHSLDNFESVIKDYDNTIDTFFKYWKYKILYKLNNNKYIYTSNINEIDNNYAIKWNRNDIGEFVEESRKYVWLKINMMD